MKRTDEGASFDIEGCCKALVERAQNGGIGLAAASDWLR